MSDHSSSLVPAIDSAQNEISSTSLILQDQGMSTMTGWSAATDEGQRALVSNDATKKSGNAAAGPLAKRQALKIVETRLGETSEDYFLETLRREEAASLEAAESTVTKTSKDRKGREKIKMQQKQHLDEYRKKKAMLRRRLQMRIAADMAQDAEPTYTGRSGALEHLEYLEIKENTEVELPLELAGFGSMGLSAREPEQEQEQGSSKPPTGEMSYSPPVELNSGDYTNVNSADEEAVSAAREMCNWLDEHGADLESLPLPGESESTKATSGDKTSGVEQRNSRGEAQRYAPLDAEDLPTTGYPYLNPLDSSNEFTVGFIPSGVKFSSVARPGARGNLLCHYRTCPIDEMHYEGPYHYKGVLGDQGHPYFLGSNPPSYLWDAYESMRNGKATWFEEEMLHYFWLWHVPPFCHVPDHDENAVKEDRDMDDEPEQHEVNDRENEKPERGRVEMLAGRIDWENIPDVPPMQSPGVQGEDQAMRDD